MDRAGLKITSQYTLHGLVISVPHGPGRACAAHSRQVSYPNVDTPSAIPAIPAFEFVLRVSVSVRSLRALRKASYNSTFIEIKGT